MVHIKNSTILYSILFLGAATTIILITYFKINGKYDYDNRIKCGYIYNSLGNLKTPNSALSNSIALYRTSESNIIKSGTVIANIVMAITVIPTVSGNINLKSLPPMQFVNANQLSNYANENDIKAPSTITSDGNPYNKLDNNTFGITVIAFYRGVSDDISTNMILYSGNEYIIDSKNTITFVNTIQKKMSDILNSFIPKEDYTLSFIVEAFMISAPLIVQPLEVSIDLYYLSYI